jgi:hypothetical protein
MSAWPLERVLFALAGTVVLVSALLAGACPASLILRRACRLRSAIYPAKELDLR